jgi:hypothetical protein
VAGASLCHRSVLPRRQADGCSANPDTANVRCACSLQSHQRHRRPQQIDAGPSGSPADHTVVWSSKKLVVLRNATPRLCGVSIMTSAGNCPPQWRGNTSVDADTQGINVRCWRRRTVGLPAQPEKPAGSKYATTRTGDSSARQVRHDFAPDRFTCFVLQWSSWLGLNFFNHLSQSDPAGRKVFLRVLTSPPVQPARWLASTPPSSTEFSRVNKAGMVIERYHQDYCVQNHVYAPVACHVVLCYTNWRVFRSTDLWSSCQ